VKTEKQIERKAKEVVSKVNETVIPESNAVKLRLIWPFPDALKGLLHMVNIPFSPCEALAEQGGCRATIRFTTCIS
jgi:hypothetical protein